MGKEEVLERKRQVHTAVGMLACAALAFLLTGAKIGGIASPLQLALAGAVAPPYSLAVLSGTLFSYFIRGTISEAAVLLCAMVLVVMVRWVAGGRLTAPGASFVVAGSVVSAAVLFFLTGTLGGELLALYLAIGVLTAIVTFFVIEVLAAFHDGSLQLRQTSSCAFAVVYLLLISAFASVQISFFNLGEVLGAFVILTAAREYKAQGGAICGLLTTCGLLLCDSQLGYRALLLGIAGLTVGFFSELAPGAMGVLFLGIQAMGQLLFGFELSAFATLSNFAIGAICFLLLPTSRALEQILPRNDFLPITTASAAIETKFLVQTLTDVRLNAERIATMLAGNAETRSAVQQVSDTVCSKCHNKLECWETQFAQTNEHFQKLASLRQVEASQVETCLHAAEVATAFTRLRRQAAMSRALAMRLSEMQTQLFTQMRVTEEILAAVSQRLQLRCSRELTKQVRQQLDRGAYPVHTVLAYYTPSGRMMLELYAEISSELDGGSVCDYLCETLGRSLSYAESETAGTDCRISLWDTPRYTTTYAAAQSNAREDELSGDHYDCFYDMQGYQYFVLSDGMGSGKKAALDARLVLSNFKRLLRAGVQWETAIQMVNAIMLTKSGEERFATLDVARLEPETGEVLLVKSGASSTLHRHADTVTMYQAPTYPIGIVPRTDPYTKRLMLSHGDTLVMLTDGVEDSLYSFIKEKLLSSSDLHGIAHAVCNRAQRENAGHADDVTVLLIQLTDDNNTDCK